MQTSSPFRLPKKTPFRFAESIAEWATGLSKLERFYAQRPAGCDTQAFIRFTLEVLGIDYDVSHGTKGGIPASGATVIVANHPLGCVEGVILAELLLTIRQDVKILANQYLKTVPELDELFIGVDVFAGHSAQRANLKALRQAHQHLANNGLILLFPAGEVSQLVDSKAQRLEDKEWSRSVSSLIRKSGATTVPVFINGQNSKRFYLAGKVHPLLRTLMLGRELLNKSTQTIKIAIGSAIQYREVKGLTDVQMTNYLRLNTYLLQHLVQSKSIDSSSSQNEFPVAQPLPLKDLLEDLDNLPSDHRLLSSGEFDVYCTFSENIPSLLHEIGRLRETNFRRAGEGTGLALDLDQFDHYYRHLFVWDRENQCLVGAYRLGLVDEILSAIGTEGLYSRTLFHYDMPFIASMGKSIEMGRSVIDLPYQKV